MLLFIQGFEKHMFTLGATLQTCETTAYKLMRSKGWVYQVKLTHITGPDTTCKGMFMNLKSEEDTLGTEPNNAELQVPNTTYKTM